MLTFFNCRCYYHLFLQQQIAEEDIAKDFELCIRFDAAGSAKKEASLAIMQAKLKKFTILPTF